MNSPGRHVIAAIGIDRYQHKGWQKLANATADARGALELFRKLGFEQVAALFDDQATGEAIEALATDDLTTLGPDDSLVVFYAGHGGTRSHALGDREVKTGYLIPCDASPDRTASWINLDNWLHALALLPAKHILVILDACYSGMALGSIIKSRGGANENAYEGAPLSALRARRSRRIITAALDRDLALDSGPVPGHSLFTGYLIEALTHGVGRAGRRVVTSTELGLYVQAQVDKYPNTRQTPDFGAFDFDDRGEMVIPFLRANEIAEVAEPAEHRPTPPIDDAQHSGHRRRIVLAAAAAASIAAASIALLAYRACGHDSQSPSAQGGCPAGMVRIPAGTFQMGSPDDEGDESEHPRHEVTLSGYCIDRTEVTVKDYRACVAAEACRPTPAKVQLRLDVSYEAVSLWCNGADHPQHPINCVTWEQAAAYCAWAHKRLPTEAEWEYAARGTDGRKYPWGNQPPNVRRLNACGAECVRMAERELKLDWRGIYNDDDGWPTTAPVGSYPAGASPFGLLDMAGNVTEWTEDAFERYSAAGVTNPRHPAEATERVFRGGSWLANDERGVRAAARLYSDPYQAHVADGLRCARGD